MNSTRITLTPELKGRLAVGHKAAMDTVENWDLPTLAGAGALRSSASDLHARRERRDTGDTLRFLNAVGMSKHG